MPASDLVIRGAREHNLRSVNLTLPRNQLICLTGVSGSGKSSLAFDTVYAEGQRRYVESLSSFARQFLGQMPKPEVDAIEGLSPSISISQKTSGQNPRSTVGTITEIYDYLRLLYARTGRGHCPKCKREITAQTREQVIARIQSLPEGSRVLVLAPLIRRQKGEYRDLFVDLVKQGFIRARVDGTVVRLTDDQQLDKQMRHDIEVVVDRLVIGSGRGRLAEAVELALKLGDGNLIIAPEPDADSEGEENATELRPQIDIEELDDSELNETLEEPTTEEISPVARRKKRRNKRVRAGTQPGDLALSAHYACTHCDLSFEPPSPQLFSFNSPQGMCGECDGLGEVYTFDPERLVTDPSKSVKNGCIELIGPWKMMGRWRRHIYKGVAETMDRKSDAEPGTLADTAWQDLTEEQKYLWLWGTGEEHITFTWRGGSASQKYGGTWDGIIPELIGKYRASKSKTQIASLEKYMRVMACPDCHGERLNPQARAVLVRSQHPDFAEKPERSLPEVAQLSIADAVQFFSSLEQDPVRARIAEEVLKEVRGRLGFLMNVGLDYLTLDRTAPTLSGGESQRIRLAGQIGCGLVGVLYILDEPSIGLHPRDNVRLIETLGQLRDLGNTVVVVEHDEDTMRAADHIVDFGPGPGVRGGEVVAEGDATKIAKEKRSLTGQYLSGKTKIEVPQQRRSPGDNKLSIVGAAHNNLKGVDVEIPLGMFVCVTGVSGSGKSSLINDILVEALRRDLNGGNGTPGEHQSISGLEHLDKLIAIDQSPIGRTPRSNPATYIKLFDDIRSLFTQLPDSKRRGYKPGRFSFNVSGGRCEKCEGNGSNRLEMDFLADVWVTCPICQGHRFNRETLQVRYKGKSIADVLEMDVQQALTHFENIPSISHKLQTLHDVGLDYLKLGQASPTLSGGEAQRIKLARELVKKSTGKTLYLLDEPTTGLHFADIHMLLKVLHDFVEAGNTVLVVEHNLDVIKTADWIIDLGPEGGAGGGEIIGTGTPEVVAKVKKSYTGRALAPLLMSEAEQKKKRDAIPVKPRRVAAEIRNIKLQGARQHNLKDVAVEIPRDKMTVCCGPSGSGKTSLAMDTIYAEGQRRYVESLSAYARQFVGQMQKPALEHIEGLSPAIAIEQKHMGHTPRSTVGTVTEIYDYLRILFARAGEAYCPGCEAPIGTQTPDEIVDKIMEEPKGTKLYLMAPIEIQVGEKYETLWDEMRASGYARVRINGTTYGLENIPNMDRRRKHAVEVVIDRISVKPDARGRIAESVESSLSMGGGVLHVAYAQDEMPEEKWEVKIHSQHFVCDKCGRSFEPLTPHSFSFNSALGWCGVCEGLGTETGANLSALIKDAKLSLAEGAVSLWPNVANPVSAAMLSALGSQAGLPIDTPFDQLTARQRRIVLYGTGDQWINVQRPGAKSSGHWFRFQYKGLYPALDDASRMSQALRGQLEHLLDEIECSVCGGSRLRDDAAAVRFRGQTIDQLSRLPLDVLLQQCQDWDLTDREKKIAGELVREIRNRLQFLVDVGLDYLSVGRSAPTLSGGEAQRIRLASQVGSGLCGVLYVLDEPTIGLHPRDNRRLIRAMEKLRDLGNTLLVVEHDREVVAGADQLLDFGPAAGRLGGEIVARGTPKQVAKIAGSVTGPYLSGKKSILIPKNRRPVSSVAIHGASQQGSDAGNVRELTLEYDEDVPRRKAKQVKSKAKKTMPKVARSFGAPMLAEPGTQVLQVIGARHNNLRSVNVTIPLGTLTAFAGVSGSGKSSLVEDVLYSQLAKTLHRARTFPGAHDRIVGVELINKVIRVDQQPLGNSPTSNPATYTGVFDLIRSLFSQLPDAKLRGYTARRFSFNVPGGRCDACDGNGQVCIEMHFLPDIWVECETCRGHRYNPETLAVLYHGRSIADVLNLSCGEAVKLFENIPKIRRVLQTLCDVGLDYLTLGQPAPTLSGGEAQRVKLAAELSRPDTGRTLYLLDEPTTGLHFDDLAKLLDVLHRLVDLGNTVVVIEHNMDVIKSCDWIIEMGPEAGLAGGQVVTCGTPEQLVAYAKAAAESGGIELPEIKPAKKRLKKNSPPPELEASCSVVIDPDKPMLRSHTGEALAPILASEPYAKRKVFDPAELEEKRQGDVEIEEVGAETQMPWEADGRRWHTEERVSRSGEACKWEGKILSEVVDRIQAMGDFSETNWNARSVVEIAAERKSDGWFMHALTGETWLLKLKFRTAKKTFKREQLIADLALKPLNDMPDLPVYGSRQRVRCKTLRGPWQEVQIDLSSWEEADTPAFWNMLTRAVKGFTEFTERVQQNPTDVMPWKAQGQKWHFSRKGFPPGKKVDWETELLEEFCELLHEIAPKGQFLWNNQQVVHLMVPQQREPWASLYTKRIAGLDVTFNGPKGQFALGRIADIGAERELVSDGNGRDQIKFRFTGMDELSGELGDFLQDHLAALNGAAVS